MPILILLGIFYLAVLPILVFVALARSSEASSKNRSLADRLNESERRLRELTQLIFDQSKATAPAPVNETPLAESKPSQPIPLVEKAALAPVPESIPEIPVLKVAPLPTPLPLSPRAIPLAQPLPAVNVPTAKEIVKDPGAEITLGARWATRIGIGFLVVTVVFFGIYISKYSTPAVRLLEVVALAAVVTGLGGWLERQAREFGEAVFAGGLAIFYFAAFAAHAILAMRVITSVELGLVVQFAAVAGIAAIAWWRNRPHVATMSVALGMVSCFFALHQDRLEITLGAALGLMLVAALLRVIRGWVWPLALGYVGAQICYGASVLATKGFALEGFVKDGWNFSPALHPLAGFAPWPGIVLVFPAAYFLLVIVSDLWAEIRGRKEQSGRRTGVVLIAAVLYGLGGWWGGVVCGHSWASYSLLTTAVLCLAVGMVYRVRKDVPDIYEILFAAAGVWIAIYFVNEYAGWIRWLALMLESFVFAWRVRRRESQLAWACLTGAWVCSWAMACNDANALPAGLAMWGVVSLKFAAWPLVSLALWAWAEKMPRKASDAESLFIGIGGMLAAVGTAVLGRVAWTDPALSWLFLALSAFAAVFAKATKTRTPWPTVWLLLPLSMWFYAPVPNSSAQTIFPALACFTVAVLVVTYGLHRRANDEQKKRYASISEIVGCLSLLYAWVNGFEAMSGGPNQMALALNLAALGLAALAWRGPWRMTGDLAFGWALAALGADWWRHDITAFAGVEKISLVLVLAIGWLWGVLARREKPGVFLLRQDKLGLYLPGILFAGWTFLAIPPGMSNGARALFLAGGAALFALIGKREWLPGGVIAAILLSVAALEKNFDFPVRALADCWIPAIVALAFLFESWLLARRFRKDNRASFDILIFLAAGISLAAFDWPVLGLVGGAQQSITLLWAGAGAVIFIAGLAARLRSFRYVGLGGLAICVPRLFLVDITDQLGRIFAFGGLAVLLLAIGFSYHKLRPWLAKPDQPEPASVPPVKPGK